MNDRRMDDWADSQSDVLKELSALRSAASKKNEEQKVLVESSVADNFLLVQSEIRSNPLLFKTFKTLKERFLTDPLYRGATDQRFVECVEMMDLSEGDE